MTREEAIEVIKAYRDKLTHSASNQLDGDIEAFNMAIEALEQLTSYEQTINKLTEAISKQATILDKIRAEILKLDDADYDFEGYYKAVTDALAIIDKYRGES